MRLAADGKSTVPIQKPLVGPVNPYTGKSLPAAPKPGAKNFIGPVATKPKPGSPNFIGPVIPKKPVVPAAKPVKAAPRVISPSAGQPVSHSTAPAVAKAPVAPASPPATTSQKQAAAAATGLPADNRWNGLTQLEVSEIIKRAKNGVAVELDPQIADIKNQAKISQDRFNSDQALAQQTTNRTVAEQKELYDRLGVSLNALNPQIQQTYDDASGKVAGNYSALQQALASRYGAAQSGTENELGRLGIQAATPQATAQMGSDKAFFQSMGDANAAQTQSGIGQSKAAAVQNLLNSMQNSSASGARLTATTLQDALAQSNADRSNQTDIMNSLLSKASTLESTRRGMEFEQSNALQDQARSQKAAAQQQAFDNQIAQDNVNIKSTLAGSDASYKSALGSAAQTNAAAASTRASAAAKQAESAARLNQTKAQAAVDAATPGTVQYQQAVANLAKTTAEAQAASRKYGTGIQGAAAYSGAHGDSKTGPIALHAVNDLIGKYPVTTKDKNLLASNYQKAVNEMHRKINANGYTGATAELLLQTLAVAYGQ